MSMSQRTVILKECDWQLVNKWRIWANSTICSDINTFILFAPKFSPFYIFFHITFFSFCYSRVTIFKQIKVVKLSRYRPGVAQRVGRGIALLFHDRTRRGGECSAARPGHTLPPGKTRYPFYRRLDGPQGRFGRAENLVPTGIRSRTVQLVVRY